MTVSITASSVTLPGNGVLTAFDYNFEIPYQADGTTPAVAVYLTSALDVVTILTSHQFSITGVGDPLGGTVTYTGAGTPLPTGSTITIERNKAITQDFAFPNNSLLPHNIELALDNVVLEMQQIAFNGSPSFVPGLNLPPVSQFGYVDASGVNDSSPGFEAAIASGLSFFVAPGTYLIESALAFDSITTNAGQYIQGSGSGTSGTPGPGTTILRPGAAAIPFITIAGTIIGYQQGISLRDLVIDLVNYDDLTANKAIFQTYAYDCSYQNIRFVNAGFLTVCIHLDAGAFVTKIDTCQGTIIESSGDGVTNPTTLSVINSDFYAFNGSTCATVTFAGGAVQPPFESAGTPVYLAANTDPWPIGYTKGTSIYYLPVCSLVACDSFTSIGCDWELLPGAYPSTYNDGTHGVLNLVPVFFIGAGCTNIFFLNPIFGSMYGYDPGYRSSFFGVGSQRILFHETTQVDGNLLLINSKAMFGSDLTDVNTFLIDASNGGCQFRLALIRPLTNGQCFSVSNAAAITTLLVSTSATPANAVVVVNGGASLKMYSDNGASVEKISLDGSTGLVRGFAAGVVTTEMVAANGTFVATLGYFNGATIGAAVQVVGYRQTGWTAPTGTLSRGTFDQSTVTLPQLAQRVAALITDLTTHGLVGT